MPRKMKALPKSEMQALRDKELQDAFDAKIQWNEWEEEKDQAIAENKKKKRTKFPGEE